MEDCPFQCHPVFVHGLCAQTLERKLGKVVINDVDQAPAQPAEQHWGPFPGPVEPLNVEMVAPPPAILNLPLNGPAIAELPAPAMQAMNAPSPPILDLDLDGLAFAEPPTTAMQAMTAPPLAIFPLTVPEPQQGTPAPATEHTPAILEAITATPPTPPIVVKQTSPNVIDLTEDSDNDQPVAGPSRQGGSTVSQANSKAKRPLFYEELSDSDQDDDNEHKTKKARLHEGASL